MHQILVTRRLSFLNPSMQRCGSWQCRSLPVYPRHHQSLSAELWPGRRTGGSPAAAQDTAARTRLPRHLWAVCCWRTLLQAYRYPCVTSLLLPTVSLQPSRLLQETVLLDQFWGSLDPAASQLAAGAPVQQCFGMSVGHKRL